MSMVKKSHVGEPFQAFQALVREGELMMSFSYDSIKATNEQGDEIRVHLWINGDWKVEYKGKEYLIRLEDNVNALIEWIEAGRP